MSPRDHCKIKLNCLVDHPSARIAPSPMLYIRPKLKYLRKRKYLPSFRKHIAS